MKKHDQAGKVEVIGGEDNFVVEIERKIECQVDDDEKEEEEGGEFGFRLFAVFAVTMNHVVFCFYYSGLSSASPWSATLNLVQIAQVFNQLIFYDNIFHILI